MCTTLPNNEIIDRREKALIEEYIKDWILFIGIFSRTSILDNGTKGKNQ